MDRGIIGVPNPTSSLKDAVATAIQTCPHNEILKKPAMRLCDEKIDRRLTLVKHCQNAKSQILLGLPQRMILTFVPGICTVYVQFRPIIHTNPSSHHPEPSLRHVKHRLWWLRSTPELGDAKIVTKDQHATYEATQVTNQNTIFSPFLRDLSDVFLHSVWNWETLTFHAAASKTCKACKDNGYFIGMTQHICICMSNCSNPNPPRWTPKSHTATWNIFDTASHIHSQGTSTNNNTNNHWSHIYIYIMEIFCGPNLPLNFPT